MNPRRDELQRQRDLIARHLAWLDGELATLPAPNAIEPSVVPPAVADAETSTPDSLSPSSGTAPWAELPSPNTQPLSRAGCWLSFSLLMAVGLGLATWALYVLYGSKEPARQSSMDQRSYQHICKC